jgi:calmodulin
MDLADASVAELTNNNSSPPSADELTIPSSAVSEWRAVFSLFDPNNTGSIPSSDLGTVIRGLGFNCTEEQINNYLNTYLLQSDQTGKIDFPTLYSILINNSPMKPPSSPLEIIEKLKSFDVYHTGSISTQHLIHILRNLGEPLTHDDVENLLDEISFLMNGNSEINIEAFVSHMYKQSFKQ